MSEPRISKETIGNSWGILLKRHFGSQVGLSSSESLKHGHRVYWMKLTSYLQQMWVSVGHCEWVSTRSIISVYDISTQEVSSCTVNWTWLDLGMTEDGDSQTTHAIFLTDSVNLLYWKPRLECQYQWSTSTDLQKLPVGVQAAQYLPEWREKTKQIDWWAKQPSQLAWFLEDLKCWGAWDTTCRHKAKDVTPSIAWMTERAQERGSATRQSSLLERTREGIINQTNIGTISKAVLGKLLRLDGVARAHNLWAFLSA